MPPQTIPLPKSRMILNNSGRARARQCRRRATGIQRRHLRSPSMPKFSQRYGYTKIEQAFQRERVDTTLRTALWNIISVGMWDQWKPYSEYVTDYGVGYSQDSQRINAISKRLWLNYFKRHLDDLPEFKRYDGQRGAYDFFKEYFFSCKWYEVYDFIEFLIQDKDTLIDAEAIKILNVVLKRENAAYRIVGVEIVEITGANEIKAIEDALSHPDDPVREHIRTALAMLSDRNEPDYRNSIKEAISAVEATCRLVTGMKVATLGDALKKIPDLHPALQKAFLALYGFTSDTAGIRHSLLDEPNLTYADAKFMLVACSAFVSYLRSKQTRT